MSKLIIRIAGLIILSATCAVAQTQTVNLAWTQDAPTGNVNTNATGYKVHYGTAKGAYTVHTDAGNVASASVSGLTIGTQYFFAITAYNAAAVESPPSNE